MTDADTGTLEFFTARSGDLSSRVRLADGSVRHIHSLVDPQAEARLYDDLDLWGDVIVFLGTGLGCHLAGRLVSLPPRSKVVLIDYYKEHVRHCREHLFGRLPNPLAVVWAGDADGGGKDLVSGRQRVQFVKHPASYRLHRAFYDSQRARIAASVRAPGPAAARSRGCVLYGNFFLQEEMRRALARSSGAPVLFHYDRCVSAAKYDSELQKTLQENDVGYVLSVNMKGFDGEGALGEITRRLGIPVIVWFVDDPYPILLQQKTFVADHMLAASWEKAYLGYLSSLGFARAFYLPLATDPLMFAGEQGTGHSYPAGFVGTSMGGAFLDSIREKFLWNEGLRPVVDRASEGILSDRTLPVARAVRDSCATARFKMPFSDERNFTWLCSYVIHTASMKKRRLMLSSLAQSGLHTFGDPAGWNALLGEGVSVHPALDYTTQLAGAYRSIAVNVNVTSCQMRSAVNQRVFDVPASGGFVLSDDQPDLRELFDPGVETVVYGDKRELAEKAAFYGRNEPARRSVAEAARRRVLAHHTYDARLAELLGKLHT